MVVIFVLFYFSAPDILSDISCSLNFFSIYTYIVYHVDDDNNTSKIW